MSHSVESPPRGPAPVSSASLGSLPLDVLRLILASLPRNHLWRVSLVSKRLLRLYRSMVTRLRRRNAPPEIISLFPALSELCAPTSASLPSGLTKLVVSDAYHHTANVTQLRELVIEDLTPTAVELASANCDVLTSLECRYALGKIPWNGSGLAETLCVKTFFRSLRRLVLLFPPRKPPNKRLLVLLYRHSHYITHLEIWTSGQDDIFVQGLFPKLRHLTVPPWLVDLDAYHYPRRLTHVVKQLERLRRVSVCPEHQKIKQVPP